jgi:phage terminase large subunit
MPAKKGPRLTKEEATALATLPDAWRVDPAQMMLDLGKPPDKWQSDFLRSNHTRTILCCSRRAGKALRVDTPIATPNGWADMGDLVEGDQVFDEQGRPCVVEACSPIEWREVFRVSFSDGSEIFADGEHLWTTLDHACRSAISRTLGDIPEIWHNWSGEGRLATKRSGKRICSFHGCNAPVIAKGFCQGHYIQSKAGKNLSPLVYPKPGAQTITTNEIAKTLTFSDRNDTNHAIPSTKPLQLPESEWLLVDPYVLGVWLGDGTTSAGTITQHDRDVEVLENVRAAGYVVQRNERKNRTTTWPVAGLWAELKSEGIAGNKHIPSKYQRSSVEQRIALLQGLMDTDGHAAKRRGRCELTLTNKRLAYDAFELILGLGLVATIKEGNAILKGRIVGRRWRIAFNPWFCPFRLRRKKSRLVLDGPRKTIRKLRYIKSVEPAGKAPVRCIQVASNSRLYLAGKTLIPTHNTSAVAVKCLHLAMFASQFDPATILLFAPAGKQTDEVVHELHNFYTALGRPVARKTDKISQLDFNNGSRIIPFASNEASARSFTPTMIVIDEGSRVEDSLYAALTPMMALGKAKMIVLSTPAGKRGWFYKEWSGGGADDWSRVKVTADDCPRISKSFLLQERKSHGDSYVEQEYFCSFTQQEGLVYPTFERNIIEPCSILKARAVAGVDFGWNNPSAFMTLLLDSDDILYIVDEIYGRMMTDELLAARGYRQTRKHDIEIAACDSANPQAITKLRRAGVPARPGYKKIREGVSAVAQRLNTGRLKCFSTCVNAIREAGLYRYDPDRLSPQDNPVDEDNHAMDAIRYAVMEIDRHRTPRKYEDYLAEVEDKQQLLAEEFDMRLLESDLNKRAQEEYLKSHGWDTFQ